MTPRLKIIFGLLDQMGHDVARLGAPQVVELAGRVGIVTPVRLWNLLAAGRIETPRRLLVDEVHHVTSSVHREIELLINHARWSGSPRLRSAGRPGGRPSCSRPGGTCTGS